MPLWILFFVFWFADVDDSRLSNFFLPGWSMKLRRCNGNVYSTFFVHHQHVYDLLFWFYGATHPLPTFVYSARLTKFCVWRTNYITLTKLMSLLQLPESCLTFLCFSPRSMLFGVLLCKLLRVQLSVVYQVVIAYFDFRLYCHCKFREQPPV